MINFREIIEGYRNLVIPPSHMKKTIELIAAERMSICDECPLHSKNHDTPLRPDDHCTDCGCMLKAKVACLSCACPQNKWTPVMANSDEEERIKKETGFNVNN